MFKTDHSFTKTGEMRLISDCCHMICQSKLWTMNTDFQNTCNEAYMFLWGRFTPLTQHTCMWGPWFWRARWELCLPTGCSQGSWGCAFKVFLESMHYFTWFQTIRNVRHHSQELYCVPLKQTKLNRTSPFNCQVLSCPPRGPRSAVWLNTGLHTRSKCIRLVGIFPAKCILHTIVVYLGYNGEILCRGKLLDLLYICVSNFKFHSLHVC